jgi:selenocysteine lyase/cysteine desulfurase
MAIANREPAQLEKQLLEEHKIHVTAVTWENMPGIRVTPNVYTSPEELQRFAEAINQMLRRQSPNSNR